jgi:hypothetical protein
MHVVGEESSARGSVRPVHRPVVAPDDRCFVGVLGPGAWGLGPARLNNAVPQIKHFGSGDRRSLNRVPNYRCFPFGSRCRQETKHRFGQRVAQCAVGLFEGGLASLQRVEHREHGED